MSGYSFGWKLREPVIMEDFGVLAGQTQHTDSFVDAGVWAPDAAADDDLIRIKLMDVAQIFEMEF